MDRTEWYSEQTAIIAMLEFCSDKRSDTEKGSRVWLNVGARRNRLWMCGCMRLCWSKLTPLARIMTRIAERYADGLIDDLELRKARDKLPRPGAEGFVWQSQAATNLGFGNSWRCQWEVLSEILHYNQAVHNITQKKLLRCIVGDPWRKYHWHGEGDLSVSHVEQDRYNPTGLYKQSTSPQAYLIAQQAYKTRDFYSLPVLADALSDSGCTDEAILTHLRDATIHARGCWVLDLLLGKV